MSGSPDGLTEQDLFPELSLDYTIDHDCADSIRSYYSYSGTAEEIEQERKALDNLMSLPTRFMTNDHIERLHSRMRNIRHDHNTQVCDSSEVALDAFYEVRRVSPMGQWREGVVEKYWEYCAYPGEGLRLLDDSYYGYNEDVCNALFSWMPESWKPPGLSGATTTKEADDK